MIFVNMVLDNKFAADIPPESFVKMRYLTALAKADLVKIEVKQGEMGEEHFCPTCFHKLGTMDDACSGCYREGRHQNWEPKPKKEETKRKCHNCEHGGYDYGEANTKCRECDDTNSNWQPISQENKCNCWRCQGEKSNPYEEEWEADNETGR